MESLIKQLADQMGVTENDVKSFANAMVAKMVADGVTVDHVEEVKGKNLEVDFVGGYAKDVADTTQAITDKYMTDAEFKLNTQKTVISLINKV